MKLMSNAIGLATKAGCLASLLALQGLHTSWADETTPGTSSFDPDTLAAFCTNIEPVFDDNTRRYDERSDQNRLMIPYNYDAVGPTEGECAILAINIYWTILGLPWSHDMKSETNDLQSRLSAIARGRHIVMRYIYDSKYMGFSSLPPIDKEGRSAEDFIIALLEEIASDTDAAFSAP